MSRKFSFSLPLIALSLAACAGDTNTNANAVPTSSIKKTEQALVGDANYIIVYQTVDTIGQAPKQVASAGGTLLASYPYGVVVASSSDPNFASNIASNPGVQSVAASGGAAGTALPTSIKYDANKFLPAAPPPASSDALESKQWNMTLIRAKQARSITRGKRSVVVGVLDSGIDDSLPDLQGQVDAQRSVSCVGGVPEADHSKWSNDFWGHGSHVAGIIAAKDDGQGVVGVAPGVSLAAIKVVTDKGQIFPESFLCGLNWAATHGVQVANASIYLDPIYFWCPSDPAQATVIEAVRRAVKDASSRGTTLFVASGDDTMDYANKTINPATGEAVTKDCKSLPLEVDGVIGVSAVGAQANLALPYSSYGYGIVDVAAPGGDYSVNVTGLADDIASGQVLSTVPVNSYFYDAAAGWGGRLATGCPAGYDPNALDASGNPLYPGSDSSQCTATFAYLQGTSQAAPHATAVAALAISKYGNMSTSQLLSLLATKSTKKACTDLTADGINCVGDANYNGVYGFGLIDAYRMVGGQ